MVSHRLNGAAMRSREGNAQVGRHCVFGGIRSFSDRKARGGYKESPYMVDTDVRSVPASQIRVPYLNEKLKQEMYGKHKQDPEEWTVNALSKQYGASMERTKAVLYLMRRREEFMKEKGVDNIPKEWYELYQKYQDLGDDASAPAAIAIEEDVGGEQQSEEEGDGESTSERGNTKSPLQKLAAEYQMSESKLMEVIEKMKEHIFRQSQVDAYEMQMGINAERLADVGVDTKFREPSSASTTVKSITDDYYPKLFGDDGAFEEARQKLIEEIELETRATITEEVDGRPDFLLNDEQADNRIPSDAENRADVPVNQLSRWKFAFKDLSKPKKFPTMIRTRRGAWRPATPLEEAARSWLKNPTPLDMEMYRDEINKWRDPDGDEQEAAQLSFVKLKRRNALKEAQGD